MLSESPAAKAPILVNMRYVKAGIVKNGPFLIYIHHVLVLGDHEGAWQCRGIGEKKEKKIYLESLL